MTAEPLPFRYDHDGLQLGGRLHGSLNETALPLVCLPGLTRNARDFDPFALAARRLHPTRPVVAFDYRGRGSSEWAADAATYTLPVETADVAAGLRHLGIARAVFVGTSRGALMIHLLAVAHRALLAGAVLNDAGPKLELEGLLAIKDYVGKAGTLPDWSAAVELVRRINVPTFASLGLDDFERMAHANFREGPEGIVADYDPRLADGLAGITPETRLPEMWDAFAALDGLPLMLIRGEHTRLLSPETVRRMGEAHPGLDVVEVAGQGHAPLLETAGLPNRIAAFANRIDPVS